MGASCEIPIFSCYIYLNICGTIETSEYVGNKRLQQKTRRTHIFFLLNFLILIIFIVLFDYHQTPEVYMKAALNRHSPKRRRQ